MRNALTATPYEKVTRHYLFDRIEVSAHVFTVPRMGTHLNADFQRQREPQNFCILGAFYCDYPSGPHLGELASMARSITGQDGFFGIASGRYIRHEDRQAMGY